MIRIEIYQLTNDSEVMPVFIVVFVCVGVEIEPEEEDMHRKEADCEENDE